MSTPTSKKKIKLDINPTYLKNEDSLDMFLSWANANPELAKKKYPIWHEELTKAVNSHPELVANLIEKLPEIFPKWLDNANKLVGMAHIDALKAIITSLENLRDKQFFDDLIENSKAKILPYINEYIGYVQQMLTPQPYEPVGFTIGSNK